MDLNEVESEMMVLS